MPSARLRSDKYKLLGDLVLLHESCFLVSVPFIYPPVSWRLYSAVSLGHQVASTMTCYPTKSHYPDTEPTSPCPILMLPSIWLGSDKYQAIGVKSTISRMRAQCSIDSITMPGIELVERWLPVWKDESVYQGHANLVLPSLKLGINRIEHGLVSSVSL